MGLVTPTSSSCGHGCSGNSHGLVTRTLSSCGHGCSGNLHGLVTRTLSSCGHGYSGPLARTGSTDVIMGNSHGRHHRARMGALDTRTDWQHVLKHGIQQCLHESIHAKHPQPCKNTAFLQCFWHATHTKHCEYRGKPCKKRLKE